MPEPRDMSVEPTSPSPQPGAGPALTDPLAVPGEPEIAVEQAAGRKLGVLGWISVTWLVVVFGAALLAPLLQLDTGRGTTERFQEPFQDLSHIMGGDQSGRDMLARTVDAARNSLMLAIGSVALGTLVGGFLGLVAGYVRGASDAVLGTFFNVLLSIPALVLVMSLVAVYASPDNPDVTSGKRMTVLVLALALIVVPVIGRITRGSTLAWSERDFVKAAQVIGAKQKRIMFREVLPNVLPATMSIALLFVAIVIVAEGSLALLGVGVDGESWGNMIANGRIQIERAPHVVFVPAGAIFFTVLSLNYLGDVIRARFDVRESVL
jgi:peptide/nickel transport system permease protein